MSSPDVQGSSPMPRVVTCEVHGLRFDPDATAGCVLCRRVEPSSGRRGWIVFAVVGISAASLLFVVLMTARSRNGGATVATASSTSVGTPLLPTASAPAFPASPLGAASNDARRQTSDIYWHLESHRAACARNDANACAMVQLVCAPDAWSADWRATVDERKLVFSLARSCGEPVPSFAAAACRAGSTTGCATVAAEQEQQRTAEPGTTASTAPPRVIATSTASASPPGKPTPADGYAQCVQGIVRCMTTRGSIDPCVEAAPRCAGPTPWLGDPAGSDCCPNACVKVYSAERRGGAQAAAALETMHRSGCYVSQ